MKKILLIEDEVGLVQALTDRLEAEGYEVTAVLDGSAGFEAAREGSFDVLVLDVMLPEKGGLDVCRDLRRAGLTTPILMLTARGQTIDKVVGLKLGADDYLVKPFEMVELLARIEALLRRSASTAPPEMIRLGDVEIDLERAEVSRSGRPLETTALEFQLLRFFVQNANRALTRDEILDRVWGPDAMPMSRTVDVHVAWLRRKIEPNPSKPRYLRTLHGIGYKFVFP